jgi:hypothetical protein
MRVRIVILMFALRHMFKKQQVSKSLTKIENRSPGLENCFIYCMCKPLILKVSSLPSGKSPSAMRCCGVAFSAATLPSKTHGEAITCYANTPSQMISFGRECSTTQNKLNISSEKTYSKHEGCLPGLLDTWPISYTSESLILIP